MRKRWLSWLLVFVMLCPLWNMPSSVFSAELTQVEKNTRKTPPPKLSGGENEGRYDIITNWNKNEVAFSDETLLEDPSDERYISRMSADGDLKQGGNSRFSYMILRDWGGNSSFEADRSVYESGNAYFEMDFGISSKVTKIEWYTSFWSDWTLQNSANRANEFIPKQIRIEYSDDHESWEGKTFTFDLSDPANPLHEAYVDVMENGSTSTHLNELKAPLVMEFDTPAKGRYYRLIMLEPYQTGLKDGNNSFNVYGLYFFDTSAPDWEGEGQGTSVDPYLISSPEDLGAMQSLLQSSRFDSTNKYFSLTNDIDMTGISWSPMGTDSLPFRGEFNGNGFLIKNLSIGAAEAAVNSKYAGLFGVNEGVIKNLGIRNVNFTINSSDTAARAGGLVGTNKGTISECFVDYVKISNLNSAVSGGFVGENQGTISNCYVSGYDNNLLSARAGGFCGDNVDGGALYNCFAQGFSDISDQAAVKTNTLGAFVASARGTIANCYYQYAGVTEMTTDDVPGAFESKTAEEFADETVMALLNSSTIVEVLADQWTQGEETPLLRIFSIGEEEQTFSVSVPSMEASKLRGTYYDDVGCWSMSNIIDGDVYTGVSSDNAKTLTLDLGEDTYASLEYLRIHPLWANGNWWQADQLNGVEIQGSNDGVLYETLGVLQDVAVDQWHEHRFESPTRGYRYFRLAAAEGKVLWLSEIEYYGQKTLNITYLNQEEMQVNTQYAVTNTYSESRTLKSLLGLYSLQDELLDVVSVQREYARNTMGRTVNETFVIKNPGQPFKAKLFLWANEDLRPMTNTIPVCTDTGEEPATKFTVPNYYAENMVLQRGKELQIAGKALPEKEIRVTIDKGEAGQVTASAVADQNGDWSAKFTPQEKGGPYILRIEADEQIKEISNVYIGEIFLAAGQSNMEFNYANWGHIQDVDFKDELEDNPNIKMLTTEGVGSSVGPKFDLGVAANVISRGKLTSWATCTAANAQYVSEIAYKVAKELVKTEPDLHVGVVCVAVGGAPIDPYQVGGSYYNQLIAPFENYTIGAFLWYQGESNCFEYATYEERMAKLINDWREAFGEEDLPFLYVQLARHIYWWATPNMQNTQRKVLDSKYLQNKENIGMVVSIDTDKGTGALPEEQNTAIHPGGKAIIGQRMADLYRKYVYGQTELITSGPMFRSAEIQGSSIIVSFDHVEEGLVIRDVDDGEYHDNSTNQNQNLCEFEIAGADKQFVTATAEIQPDNTIKVYAESVTEPKFVRYAFTSAYPLNPNLYNQFTVDGEVKYLPASPFNTAE